MLSADLIFLLYISGLHILCKTMSKEIEKMCKNGLTIILNFFKTHLKFLVCFFKPYFLLKV